MLGLEQYYCGLNTCDSKVYGPKLLHTYKTMYAESMEGFIVTKTAISGLLFMGNWNQLKTEPKNGQN